MTGKIVQPGEEDTIEFNKNGRSTGSITTGFLHYWVNVRLDYQLTLASADNTQANTARGDAWSVLDNLKVRADGSKPLKDIDPNLLWWQNYIMHNGKPEVAQELGDTGITDPTVSTQLTIPFWFFFMVNQGDYTLDPRDLDSLEIVANWNEASDVNSNATGFNTDPTLTITSMRSEYAPSETQYRYSLFKEYKQEKEITSTTSNFTMDLPTDGVVAGVLFEFTDAGADDGDVLNRLNIEASGTTYMSYSDEDLRMMTHNILGLPRDFDGQNYNDLRISDDNDVDGIYFWTPSYEGNPGKLIDTDQGDGIPELEAKMDVTVGGGTTKCHAHIMQVFPAIESRDGGVTFRQSKQSGGSGNANSQKQQVA